MARSEYSSARQFAMTGSRNDTQPIISVQVLSRRARGWAEIVGSGRLRSSTERQSSSKHGLLELNKPSVNNHGHI